MEHLQEHTHTELHNYQPQQCLTQAGDAAAVATRERYGRVETAGGRLGEDWPETMCVLMSSICSSRVCRGVRSHTHTIIHQHEQEDLRTSGPADLPLFFPLSSVARPPTIIHVHTCRENRTLYPDLRSTRRRIRACRAQTTATTVGLFGLYQ